MKMWVVCCGVVWVGCGDGGEVVADTADTSDVSETDTVNDTDTVADTANDTDTVADTANDTDTASDTDTVADTSDTQVDTTPEVVEVPAILINEVAAALEPSDWVELYNAGATAVDLSGWVLRDNDPTHQAVIATGTTIAAGAYLVLDQVEGAWGFGLGSDDSVVLSTAEGALVDAVSWLPGDAPVGATWARLPDGGDTWATSWEPTPGAANAAGTAPDQICGDGVLEPTSEVCDTLDVGGRECLRWGFAGGTLGCAENCQGYDFSACTARTGLVINEVSSADDDPVELYNGSAAAISLAGYRLVDDGDNSYTFPDVQIAASAYLVLRKGTDHTFGIGGGDALWLYDATGELVDHVDWDEGEALYSYCRVPNATGGFQQCSTATFGTVNAQ